MIKDKWHWNVTNGDYVPAEDNYSKKRERKIAHNKKVKRVTKIAMVVFSSILFLLALDMLAKV